MTGCFRVGGRVVSGRVEDWSQYCSDVILDVPYLSLSFRCRVPAMIRVLRDWVEGRMYCNSQQGVPRHGDSGRRDVTNGRRQNERKSQSRKDTTRQGQVQPPEISKSKGILDLEEETLMPETRLLRCISCIPFHPILEWNLPNVTLHHSLMSRSQTH